MADEDGVYVEALYNVCQEKEEQALRALREAPTDVPAAVWDVCMQMGELEQSYFLLKDCIDDRTGGN